MHTSEAKPSFRPSLVGLLAGLFLAAGLVISAALLTRAYMASGKSISVTGSAKKEIQSDLMLWRASYSVEAANLADAHRALKLDADKVKTFLTDHNVGTTNYKTCTIAIQESKITKHTDDAPTPVYNLSQSIEVQSTNLDLIRNLDTDCSQLVEQGVVFTTSGIQYLYTKAAEAKIEMLAEATRDARARADQIAKNSDCQIASLRDARMGVFQITPVFGHETSWEGQNDTTSYEKTITAVVSATFALK
jgi:hypothetical protein